MDRLSSCVWLKSHEAWQEEFGTMARRGFKVEMEATYALSPQYLAETYLLERIAAGDHFKLSAVSSK